MKEAVTFNGEVTDRTGQQALQSITFGVPIDSKPKLNMDVTFKQRKEAGQTGTQKFLERKSPAHRPSWYKRNNHKRLCWKKATLHHAVLYGITLTMGGPEHGVHPINLAGEARG